MAGPRLRTAGTDETSALPGGGADLSQTLDRAEIHTLRVLLEAGLAARDRAVTVTSCKVLSEMT